MKALVLTLLFITGSVLATFSGPFVENANAAMSESECYALNGTEYNNYSANDTLTRQTECISLGFCKPPTPTGTSALPKIECNRAYYETTDQYKAQRDADNARILDAQIQPLVPIICPGVTADTAKQACISDITKQYPICANGAEEGSPTDDQINTAIATCMRNWAKTAYPTAKIDLAKLTAAVAEGRGNGSDEANKIGNEKDKTTCEANGGTWADGKCAEKSAAQCSGGPLGWILCPVAQMAENITSELGKNISSFMTFTPLLNSTQGKAIESVWRIVVNIANILLVIAFLMVVFSQATSVGLTNYGIKKMLPKIVAAAILMNLSFFICAVAVDVTNIIGQSVAGIIQVGIDALPSIDSGLVQGDVENGGDAGDNTMFGIFALLGVGGLIATGNIFLVLPVLASAAVAVFTAFAVIMLRQVAVVIMIIIAPLAFAAWILPNTESWFEKWRKLFISLLLMFPLIMVIMYGATFMSRIMLVTLDPTKSGLEINTVKVMAIAVLVLPLFALPFIMKVTGGILERFGVWSNNRQKGIIDRSKNLANDAKKNSRFANAMEFRRENRATKRAVRRGNTSSLFNQSMRPVGGKGYQAYTVRKATAIEDKEFEQAVADAATGQRNTSSPELQRIAKLSKEGLRAEGRSKYEQVSAARWVGENGNFDERSKLYESISRSSDERLRQSVSQSFFKKGDAAIMGAAYGGQLLEGNSGGVQGRLAAVGSNIENGKITAASLVHDAQATEDIATVLREGYVNPATGQRTRVSDVRAEGVVRSAEEALTNEATRQKATADVYYRPINELARQTAGTPAPTPTPTPGGGGNPGSQGGGNTNVPPGATGGYSGNVNPQNGLWTPSPRGSGQQPTAPTQTPPPPGPTPPNNPPAPGNTP